MTKKILVVDDEERLRVLLQSYLRQEGFEVVTAVNGREALFVARQEQPDLIILDLMMPEMDGFSFMHAHNKERSTPVIILTAKLDEQEKVLGLELGADDFVTKPFSLRELTARVRAVLRRVGQVPPVPERLRASDIVLDRSTRLVQVEDRRVELTPSEFDLLAALMAQPGRAFTRAELLDRVQGMANEGYERTIDVHVRNLRAKIEPNSRHPRYIETVFGIGYRFSPEDYR
ncbi:MAG: response regulator transcription factor [Caldilineaceae bacterium]|nr:response regulator transcription factor [Caldilineaceae bacterium]